MDAPRTGWRPSIVLDDPEQTTEAIRRSMPAATVVGAGGPFRFRGDQDVDDRLDLTRWWFRAHVDGGRSTETTGVTVVAPTAGTYHWDGGGESGTHAAPFVMRHGVAYRGRSEDLGLTVLRLEQSRFDDLAAAVRGDDPRPVRFASSSPSSKLAADRVAQAVQLQVATLTRPAPSSDLVDAAVYRLLVVSLVDGLPPAGPSERERTCRRRTLTTVERALRYVDDHAALPITVADVARHVGTSEAGLRRAFAAWRDGPPEEALERARLAGAHRDLLAATPGDVLDVDGIATRWGFGSTRRFAERYRAAYRVDPGTTLQTE